MDFIWLAIVVVFICWVLGIGFHVAGDLVNVLLVLLVIGVAYQVITGMANRPRL